MDTVLNSPGAKGVIFRANKNSILAFDLLGPCISWHQQPWNWLYMTNSFLYQMRKVVTTSALGNGRKCWHQINSTPKIHFQCNYSLIDRFGNPSLLSIFNRDPLPEQSCRKNDMHYVGCIIKTTIYYLPLCETQPWKPIARHLGLRIACDADFVWGGQNE